MYVAMKLEEDVTSPEGVEERVKDTFHTFVTLTQGGRYRVYVDTGDDVCRPQSVHTELEAARKAQASIMGVMASMVLQPEKTINAMLNSLEQRMGPKAS